MSTQGTYYLMDRTITLRPPVESRDGAGAEIVTPGTTEDIPVAVRYITVRDEAVGGNSRIQGYSIPTFTMRYRDGVTTKHDLVYQGEEYDILGVTEINRREYLQIKAIKRK